jgi:hypothetical protein
MGQGVRLLECAGHVGELKRCETGPVDWTEGWMVVQGDEQPAAK